MQTRHAQTDSLRAQKRERFTAAQQERSRHASPAILAAGMILVLAIIGGALWIVTRAPAGPAQAGADFGTVLAGAAQSPLANVQARAATTGHAPYPLVEAIDGAVRLPLATFDDRLAHYYTYMHDDAPIEFFVLKSKDGVVRAAFNACDVCYPARRGYRLEGDEVVCLNCGRRFPTDQINVVRGGCNPSPLERSIKGDTLVIRVSDIIAGAGYF